MHLENALLVMVLERLVVRRFVFFSPAFRLEPNRHRGTKHRQTLLKHDDSLFMQKHQSPLNRSIDVLYFCPEQQVPVNGPVELFKVKFQQEIGAGLGDFAIKVSSTTEASRRRFQPTH
jgi:hypothetical protein